MFVKKYELVIELFIRLFLTRKFKENQAMEYKVHSAFNISPQTSQFKVRKILGLTQRNFSLLSKRLKILQRENLKKEKDLSHAVERISRNITINLDKSTRKQFIKNRQAQIGQKSEARAKSNRQMRERLSSSISKVRSSILEKKKIVAEQVRKNIESLKNQSLTFRKKQQKRKEEARLSVRMREIEGKEKIANFWQRKIKSRQQQKKFFIIGQINKYRNHKKQMLRIQKREGAIIGQLVEKQELLRRMQQIIGNEELKDGYLQEICHS